MSEQKVSRRTLLGGLAAAGVAPTAHRLSGGGGQTKESLDIAVIAEPTGFHLRLFLNGLATCQRVGRVAISDASGQAFGKAQEMLGDRLAGSFRDHHEMLSKFRPGLTIVTLEGHHTPPVIESVLEAGSHVLTEKPGCVRLRDFEKLARLADSRKLQVMLAMVTRSSGAIKKAMELIQKGFLGKPYSTTLDWIADQTRLQNPKWQESWVSFKDKGGGGKLMLHGIHYLDIIEYLVGDWIDRVSCICENVGGTPIEVEDAAVLSFRMRNSLVGTLNTGYYLDRGYQNQIRVWGSEGWFHVDLPAGTPLKWYSTHPNAPRGIQEFSYRDDPGMYEIFLQECIDALLGLRKVPITTAEGVHVLKTTFTAYESSERGITRKVV